MHLGWYGIAVGSLLLLKLLGSLRRRKNHENAPPAAPSRLTLHSVITCFNESPAMLDRCLASILGQSARPASITVIDDASADPAAAVVADGYVPAFAAAGIRLNVIRFAVNLGKRHGLAAGFDDAPDADVYLCVDSDTVLDPGAFERLGAQFDDERIHAATGLVLAHNRAKNLLTRLIDMRYQNAFLGERVAYSRLGSVLCACGSLAAYRGWVVRKHLDDFLGQRFLGRPCTFGDDRRLTYYALTEGKSVIQPTAVAWTDVPANIPKWLVQQCRWTKSFIREAVLLALKGRARRAYWWLNLVELVTWVAFTSGLIVALAAFAGDARDWTILVGYSAYVSAASWLRSLHYLRKAGDVPTWDRWLTFLAAPAYALLNLTLLIPLRLYALTTLRRNGWGTRGGGKGPRGPRPSVLGSKGQHRRRRGLGPALPTVNLIAPEES
jgi:hyaluronan synthase